MRRIMRRAVWAGWFLRRGILPLHGATHRFVQGLAHRPGSAMVSDTFQCLLPRCDEWLFHRSVMHGLPSRIEHLQASNNRYRIRSARRCSVSHQRRRYGAHGRQLGYPRLQRRNGSGPRERGTFYNKYEGLEKALPVITRPPLPPGVEAGGHGGSHGHLTEEFVSASSRPRPCVDAALALNMTVPAS